MKKILFYIAFIFSLSASAQQTVYDTTFTGAQGNAWAAMVNLPDNYYTTGRADSFSCYLFINGNGESAQSGGVDLMDNNGPHYWLRQQNWNGEVPLPNGTHKVIYISLQLPIPNTNPVTSGANYLMKPKLDAILSRYRIKGKKFHGLFISGGVGTALRFHTYKPTVDDDTYAKYFWSAVSVQSRIYTSNEGADLPYPQRFGHTAKLGFKALCFYNHLDGSDPDATWSKNMRDSVPNSATYIKTAYSSGGVYHCCFNEYFNPNANNWTTSNGVVMTVTGPSISGMNVYQWSLIATGDTNFVTGPTGIIASAGEAFWKAYDQNNNTPTFSMTGTWSNGTAASVAWSVVSGPNTPTLSNSGTPTVNVIGATKGHYVFRFTVTDNLGNVSTSDRNVWIRDLNEAGSWPCRPGGGKIFHIGNTLIPGVVTTTYINLPYGNRPPYGLGEQIMGGDELWIYRNPNNGGNWQTIVLGYFGGSEGCPVKIRPAPGNIVQWGASNNQGYLRAAAAAPGDTNYMNHVWFNGMANRVGNQDVYNFEHYSPDTTGIAIVAHHVRNIRVDGLYSRGGIVFMKKDSDSSKPHTIYNNYNPGPYTFRNMSILNTEGEAFYVGPTDVDGQSFDGPTVKGANGSSWDSIIVANTGWDGIQPSNLGDGVRISNIFSYNTGTKNLSSQQSASFIGGYNTNAIFERSVMIKGTGGPNFLGAAKGWFRLNIVDSMGNGGAVDYSSLYVSSSVASSQPPAYPDSLEMFTQNNIIANSELWAINYANTNGRMKDGGEISGNIIVDASGRTNLINTNNVVVPQFNNTYVTSLNIDGTALAKSLPAWGIYKLFIANPNARISFFDLPSLAIPKSSFKFKPGSRIIVTQY